MTDPPPSALRELWLDAFEGGLKALFPDHFGDVDWHCVLDRAGLAVTAGDPFGGRSVTIELPRRYLEQNPWLLAGERLAHLRRMAEESGFLQARL